MIAYVIGVVVLLPVLYRVLLTLSCPQCLKPFPEISLVQYLKRTFQRCPVDQRLKFVCDSANEEGLAKIFFAGTWTLVVTNPLYARKILSDIDTFPKQEMKVLLKGYLAPELMGNNVANENGDAWKRHRRVVAPAFHNFQPYVDVFGHSAAEFGNIVRNARSNGGRELDVSNLLSLMTIDIICKAGFSYDLGAMKESATNPWMKHYQDFIAQLFNPLYFLFPMLEKLNIGNRKGVLLASNAGLNDMFYQMIDQRRQEINRWKGQKPDGIEPKSGDPIKDLLALMIQASDAEESSKTSLSPKELRNNLLVFFIAGHETTANSLASTLYYLSVHPEIQEKARLECENAMAGRPKNATATFEEQKKMVYVTGVIKESLRLNAPAGQLSNRIVNKPEGTTLGSHHFPYGTTMQIHMYAMHHNPEVWKNPYDFDPTRFLQKVNQEKGKENPEDGVWTNEYQEKSGGHMSEQERICWSPFGAGPRACLGMNFSLIEQRVFLSHILRQFRLKLPANSKHSNGIINEPFPITKPADMKIIFEELK